MKTAGSASGSPGRTSAHARRAVGPGSRRGPAPRTGPRLRTSREKSTTALPARPSYATREEGRSLRSMHHERAALAVARARATRRRPTAAAPAPAVCVSRQVPGCGSPIVNGGPGQSGSRQSAPARKAWIVGVTAPGGAASSSVARDEHQRHRRLDHGLRAKARHARIGLRDPRHRHARQPQRRRQPHRHAQAAARELRDAHRLDRERLASRARCPPSDSAKSREPRAPRRGPRRGGRPAPPSGTAPASSGG